MKFRIDNPCFIEAEGQITITPIDLKAEALANAETQAEYTKRRKSPSRAKHKARKGRRAKCSYCHTNYISHSSRSRFCRDAHRHAWMRQRGITYPLPKGRTINSYVDEDQNMHIEAGATGVKVNES